MAALGLGNPRRLRIALPAVDAVPSPQAALRLVVGGRIEEVQVVRVHEVEADRPARAMDLQPQLVFGSDGDFRGLDRTHRTRTHLCQDHHAILGIDRDLPGRVGSRRPFGVGDLRHGRYGTERSDEPIHQVDHVRCQVGDHAAPGRSRSAST